MARPKPDIDAIRGQLIEAAETMLQETDGERLILSELARRVGLTQSHAHSFFATKNDLVRALAERWFAEVESAVAGLTTDTRPASDRLEAFVLTILRLKRAKYDENPKLFLAYLSLARGHMDIVSTHSAKLHETLQAILRDVVSDAALERTTNMVWDATAAFRVPHMIALSRNTATDARARDVVGACLVAIEHGQPPVTH